VTNFFRATLSAVTIAALGNAAACSKADSAPPVATVSFQSNRTRVAQGSPVDLTYRFVVAPGAQVAGNYRVFVHVKNADGQLIWGDDHDPSVPTSQWKPGQTIEYTRTKFVPVYPYVGEATVWLGLHRDSDRLPLQGPDAADRDKPEREYKVGTLTIMTGAENIFVIKKNGWYPAEYDDANLGGGFQWTQKVAVFDFPNPRKNVAFYLEYDARPDMFPGQPQQISIYAGTEVVQTFTANNQALSIRLIEIPAAALGSGEMAEIRIELDKTFVPAKMPSGGTDTRELGIRVYHAYVETR